MPTTRRLLLFVTTAVSLCVALSSRADDLLFDRFGDYVESLRAQAGIPGLAAALVGNNDIVWERAFGRQDIERSIATRTDTPFHLDGVTQVFTATLVLRCVEEGHLSLDDPIGRFFPDTPEPDATLQQILTHTSGPSDHLVYAYHPERLGALGFAVLACTGASFRETLAGQLARLAMVTSAPGPDALRPPPAQGIPDSAAVERYASVLARLATPYAVDQERRASPSRYTATTLTPASGLISTVRDVAQLLLALRKGLLLRADTLASAWRAPLGREGQRLPHGLGWFVQSYNGEAVVWQFGAGENGSSSLVVTVPSRGLSLVLLGNSTGLVKPFALTAGDLTASPFGRLFLGMFVR